MLKINNLSVSFNTSKSIVNALGPLSLNINPGETYAVIGPSGCGKSTLLNVLSGVIKHHQGELKLNNETINPVKHNIGFIPQNFGLLPWKTVKQNCLLSLKIKHMKLDTSYDYFIDDILKRLDIIPLLDRLPKELSGGQMQRVVIARAFIM